MNPDTQSLSGTVPVQRDGAFRLRPRGVAVLVLVMLVGVFIGSLLAFLVQSAERVTLVSLSPNDRFRVHLVETNLPISLDRNFVLRLERLTRGSKSSQTTIFRSPDEGRPVGSERIVWSPDGRQFVLIGRHFYAHSNSALPNGESLYLLFDLATGKLACNSDTRPPDQGFGIDDVSWVATE